MQSLHLEDIGDIDHVVDLASISDVVTEGERFPSTYKCNGGFIVSHESEPRVLYVRWVVPNRYGNRWTSPDTLYFAFPAVITHGLRAAIWNTKMVNVLLLFSGQRYDVGTFGIQEVCRDGVILRRQAYGNNLGYKITLKQTGQTLERMAPDSHLETQIRILLAFCGIAVLYERFALSYRGHNFAEGHLHTYTPDGILFSDNDSEIYNWCMQPNTEENWHQHCMLLEIKPVFPSVDVFEKLKSVCLTYRWSILILYGDPTVPPTAEKIHYGCVGADKRHLMGIVIRPSDGETRRVYFEFKDEKCTKASLCLGETGEHGHASYMMSTGHNAVRYFCKRPSLKPEDFLKFLKSTKHNDTIIKCAYRAACAISSEFHHSIFGEQMEESHLDTPHRVQLAESQIQMIKNKLAVYV